MRADGPQQFCDEVRSSLVGALTLATGRRDVAEELAQETLVRVWQRWDRVSVLESPERWTMRVGFNLVNSWHRRRAAEWRANRRSSTNRAAADVDTAVAVAVRDAVASLPPRQRAVIVARFFLGYDVVSTAELLGIAEGTVKATTHQALAKLRGAGLIESNEAEEAMTP